MMMRDQWLDCGDIIEELGVKFQKLIRISDRLPHGSWRAESGRATSGMCGSPIEALNALKVEVDLIAAAAERRGYDRG